MAAWDDVRELALALPDTSETLSRGEMHWRVHHKAFVWERHLRRADLEELHLDEQGGPVLAARVEDEAVKRALIVEDRSVFFTTRHFDGWPIVLVRLDRISRRRLSEIVAEAWLARAPARLAREHLESFPD